MSLHAPHHGLGHDNHHHHHHHHARDMFTSISIGNSGTRIVQLGLASNLALALIKLVSGWALRSKSLTADAWHSFSDLTVDCLALFALLLTSLLHKNTKDEAASARIERLLSVAAAGLLIYTASHVGWESLLALTSFPVEHALMNEMVSNQTFVFHDHHHGSEVDESPSIQAIWPAALTFVVKEWLYRATMKVAQETKSSILESNAEHQRADSLVSIVTIIAILGGIVMGNTTWIDSIGGLCISAMIMRAAWGILRDSLGHALAKV